MTDQSTHQEPDAPRQADDSVPRWLLLPLIAVWVALIIFVAIMLSEGSTSQPPVHVDNQALQQSLNNLSGGLDLPATVAPVEETAVATP